MYVQCVHNLPHWAPYKEALGTLYPLLYLLFSVQDNVLLLSLFCLSPWVCAPTDHYIHSSLTDWLKNRNKNGSKLCQRRLKLDIKRHFFIKRVVTYWNPGFPERWSMFQPANVLRDALNNILTFGQLWTDQALGLDCWCRSLPNKIVYSILKIITHDH